MYEIQCGLRARKHCQMCGEWLVVSDFGGYQVQPCEECARHRRRYRLR